jgi:hypothetical protein
MWRPADPKTSPTKRIFIGVERSRFVRRKAKGEMQIPCGKDKRREW